MDDGRAAAGKAVVYNRHVCTDSTSATDYASQYVLNYQGTACGFYFANMF